MAVETILYTTLRGDSEPVEELPAEIISYSFRLNRPGAISFSLALDHPFCTRNVIAPGTNEVVVERNKAIVWRGPILTADEDSEKVSFGGEGLLAYTKRWHITSTLTFAAVDQFTIARALVDHHQDKAGGDFGLLTTGADTSGVTRDRTYEGFQRKGIYEALTELVDVDNGFDLNINPNSRLLELHYPQQGTRQNDLIWEDGIRSFSRTIDSSSQASQILGVGEGEGDDQLVFNLQDSGAVAQYGLTQGKHVNKDVSVAATLQDQVRRQLSYLRTPPETFQVSVGTGSFNPFSHELGVEGQLRYDSPYEEVNRFMRMIGFDIRWEAGDERAILILETIL
jgi:hypothetical protein